MRGHLIVAQRREGTGMEKMVLDAMKKAGKPVRPGDVAKMIGAESKDVSKVIDDLKKKGKVTSPKRCYYAPAEG
jgi:Mn-dependent DtxR family transcriptional regulator